MEPPVVPTRPSRATRARSAPAKVVLSACRDSNPVPRLGRPVLSQLSFKRKRGRAAVTPPPGREALDDDRDSNPDLPLSLPTRIRTWGLLLPKQTG